MPSERNSKNYVFRIHVYERLLGDNLVVSMHIIPLEKSLGVSVCFRPLERDYKNQSAIDSHTNLKKLKQ